MVRLKPSPTQSLPLGDGVSWQGTLYIFAQNNEDSSDELEPLTEHPQEVEPSMARNLLSSSSTEKKPSLWDQRRGGDAHPLHGHPGLEPFNDMQVLIIDAIAEIGEPAGFDQILNSVSSRWRGVKIRRRDGTPYTTDCRRAIQANLRTNPHQVSLFIRVTTPDGGAAWRFSQSIEEAEEAKIKSKFEKGKEPKAEDGSLLASVSSPHDIDAQTRKSVDDSSEDSLDGESNLGSDRKSSSGRASMLGGALATSYQGRPVRSTRHAGGYNLNGFSSDEDHGEDESADHKLLLGTSSSASYMESSINKLRNYERRDHSIAPEIDMEAPAAKRKAMMVGQNGPGSSSPATPVVVTSPSASNVSFSSSSHPSHMNHQAWSDAIAHAAAVANIDPAILMSHYMRPDLNAAAAAHHHHHAGWMQPLFGYQPFLNPHQLMSNSAPYLQHQMAMSSLEKASQSSSEEVAASLTTTTGTPSSGANHPSSTSATASSASPWNNGPQSSSEGPTTTSAHLTFSSSSTSTSSHSSTTTSSATIAASAGDASAFRMNSPVPSSTTSNVAQNTSSHEQSSSTSFASPNSCSTTSPQGKETQSFPNITWS